MGVLDTTIPFGSVSFTPEALVAKQNHVNAVFGAMDSDSNVALWRHQWFKQVCTLKWQYSQRDMTIFGDSPPGVPYKAIISSPEFRLASVPDAATTELTNALQNTSTGHPRTSTTIRLPGRWPAQTSC